MQTMAEIALFFLEDISYSSDGSQYSYTVEIDDLEIDDNYDAQLHIEGLSSDVTLTDEDGNSIGDYVEDHWVLSSSELDNLGDDDLSIQIVSPTEIDIETQDYEISLVQGDFDDGGSTLMAGDSFNFDLLEDIVTVTLNENSFDEDSINLENLLQLSQGQNQLEIVSTEADNQTLTLDANSWELKTDSNGEALNVSSDDGSAFVYTSVDADVGFDLVIDEMITVILES